MIMKVYLVETVEGQVVAVFATEQLANDFMTADGCNFVDSDGVQYIDYVLNVQEVRGC